MPKIRISIISPYPPPRTKHIYGSGVASYTKSLAEALRNMNSKIEVHVIADYKGDLPRLYIDNNIIVHRVYKKGPLYILQIFKELCKIKPSITHVQHEYFLYGGLITAILFPLLIALSKLVSRKVIVTVHGVIPLKLLEDQEFKKENGIHGPTLILKLGLLLVTKLIILFSNKVIVHEPFLKEYLLKDYKEDIHKIVVIPHGVEDRKPLPKDKAKKKLGLEGKIVLLYFGYLTGYKGIKELLEAYKELTKKVPDTILLIAGGPHPRLAREKWYRDWIRDIIRKARSIQKEIRDRGKILFLGYVPESEIPLYFSVADLVVLPHKARIAASGSEALAIAFEKPFLMFKDLEKSKGYPLILTNSILNLINQLRADKCRITHVKVTRKWCNIAKIYLKVYSSDHKSSSS